MRTRLKILEKECKKKDQQIDELLQEEVSFGRGGSEHVNIFKFSANGLRIGTANSTGRTETKSCAF